MIFKSINSVLNLSSFSKKSSILSINNQENSNTIGQNQTSAQISNQFPQAHGRIRLFFSQPNFWGPIC
ncbi:hypothetical protein CYY_007319 [Polysphondylium violaceum]|uniref:Uncharacterized protein n=1 Tax=Polysphondylium violaceum TaxID=133409 RepID=A0A8J4PR47_9MYCE|nr:hypothetical protein CYY_007319 [Polysphondylium violaceum]